MGYTSEQRFSLEIGFEIGRHTNCSCKFKRWDALNAYLYHGHVLIEKSPELGNHECSQLIEEVIIDDLRRHRPEVGILIRSDYPLVRWSIG